MDSHLFRLNQMSYQHHKQLVSSQQQQQQQQQQAANKRQLGPLLGASSQQPAASQRQHYSNRQQLGAGGGPLAATGKQHQQQVTGGGGGGGGATAGGSHTTSAGSSASDQEEPVQLSSLSTATSGGTRKSSASSQAAILASHARSSNQMMQQQQREHQMLRHQQQQQQQRHLQANNQHHQRQAHTLANMAAGQKGQHGAQQQHQLQQHKSSNNLSSSDQLTTSSDQTIDDLHHLAPHNHHHHNHHSYASGARHQHHHLNGSSSSSAAAAAAAAAAQSAKDSQSGSRFLLGVLFTIAELLLFATVFLWLYWTYQHADGLAWQSDRKQQFDTHAALMLFGFIFLSGQAMLIHRSFSCCSKIYTKILHTILFVLATSAISLGLILAYTAQENVGPNHKPIMHFYSLHAWCGLTTVGLFALQFVFGFVSFLILLCCDQATARFRAALLPIHKTFGLIIFSLAVATCLMGLLQTARSRLSSKLNKTDYHELAEPGIIINLIGVCLICLAILMPYIIRNLDIKRPGGSFRSEFERHLNKLSQLEMRI